MSEERLPIGYAEITPEGIIQLFLRAESEDGTVGHGILVYSPHDPEYSQIIAHLGAIEPGQKVPVYAWGP